MTSTAQAQTESRPQPSPAALRKCRADLETVKEKGGTGTNFLRYKDDAALAEDGMKRTWRAAKDCAVILREIHESKIYLDVAEFGNWSKVCRFADIKRRDSYRLMHECANLTGPNSVATAPAPLALADETERDEGGETAPESLPFTPLRELLQKTAAETDGKLVETTSPPKPHDAAWMEMYLKPVLAWFDDRGMDQQWLAVKAIIAAARNREMEEAAS
jgi:hypothetical protein